MEKQQMYTELQMLVQQAKQVKSHLENIDSQITDLRRTILALEDFGKSKEGSKMLSQISNGIFVRSTLEDTKNVILNVGADTGVEKTLPEAQNLVKKQLSDMSEVRDHFINQFNVLREKIQSLQEKLK